MPITCARLTFENILWISLQEGQEGEATLAEEEHAHRAAAAGLPGDMVSNAHPYLLHDGQHAAFHVIIACHSC